MATRHSLVLAEMQVVPALPDTLESVASKPIAGYIAGRVYLLLLAIDIVDASASPSGLVPTKDAGGRGVASETNLGVSLGRGDHTKAMAMAATSAA